MRSEADAMIGHAILRKVVGADLLAAVTRADHGLAFLGQGILLLLLFHLVEPRTQDAHTLFAVLDLRLLVLAAHYRICRQVRDAYRRIRSIHRLPART